MNSVYYPRLVKRVRAALIDSFVFLIVAVAALAIGYYAGMTAMWQRILLVSLTVLFLEPGLVTLTGGTIGHHIIGIRVRKMDGVSNLNFLAATFRTIVKFLLGWFSFIMVLTTRRHQAIHDLVARSVVVHEDIAGLPSYEVLAERQVESDEFIYPAKWKRVLMIFLHWILVTVALFASAGAVISGACMMRNQCSTFDFFASLVVDVLWLIITGVLAVYGWSGRLSGAKRHKKAPDLSSPNGAT